MWTYSALASFLLAVVVVVPLVQAQIRRSTRTAGGMHQHAIERGSHHPLVVDVGAGERYCDGNTSAISQNVAFGAAFSAIGGIGANEVPPLGALTMVPSSEAHSQSMPRSTW